MSNTKETLNQSDNSELHKTNVSRHLEDVLVNINGKIIPIRELPRDEYEKFLEMMTTWSKFYWRKHGGDKIKKCEDVKI